MAGSSPETTLFQFWTVIEKKKKGDNESKRPNPGHGNNSNVFRGIFPVILRNIFDVMLTLHKVEALAALIGWRWRI